MASLIAEKISEVLLDLDLDAATKSVDKLRKKHPNAEVDELVAQAIQRKCMQAGAVGAVTSGTAIIPNIGTVAAMTFGVAVDMQMTFKIQSELVLEIAAIYNRPVSKQELQNIILTVTGISAGSQVAVEKVGQVIATKVTAEFAEKSVAKAVPFIGVAVTGGANMITTYVIGKRAEAYFKLGPAEMVDWPDTLRALSGVNEKEIVGWLHETTESSYELIRDGSMSTKNAVVVASEKTRTAVVVYSNRASEAINSTRLRIVNSLTNSFNGSGPIGDESTEERPNFFQRLFSIFQKKKKPDTQQNNPMTEEKIKIIAEKLSEAEIEDEVIVGVIGADDAIDGAKDEKHWNLNNALDMFNWNPKNWNVAKGRKANIEEVKELYVSESQAEVVIVGDDDGFMAPVRTMFRRNK